MSAKEAEDVDDDDGGELPRWYTHVRTRVTLTGNWLAAKSEW